MAVGYSLNIPWALLCLSVCDFMLYLPDMVCPGRFSVRVENKPSEFLSGTPHKGS